MNQPALVASLIVRAYDARSRDKSITKKERTQAAQDCNRWLPALCMDSFKNYKMIDEAGIVVAQLYVRTSFDSLKSECVAALQYIECRREGLRWVAR